MGSVCRAVSEIKGRAAEEPRGRVARTPQSREGRDDTRAPNEKRAEKGHGKGGREQRGGGAERDKNNSWAGKNSMVRARKRE